jgi:hypothetical protein
MKENETMNGVDYISSLESDIRSTKKEQNADAKMAGATHCIYSIAIDGVSAAEGMGTLNRGLGIIFSDHGKKYVGSHQSGPIVALTLALNPEAKVERAVKYVLKEECKPMEDDMHVATDFIVKRGDKTQKLLKLWNEFCSVKGLSTEAHMVGLAYVGSAFDMFRDIKQNAQLNVGFVTPEILEEIQTALGYNL